MLSDYDKAGMLLASECEKLPELTDAYFDGYLARQDGVDDWDNPYPHRSVGWEEWLRGWTDVEFDER